MSDISLLGFSVSSAGCDADVEAGIRLMRDRSSVSYMACLNPHSLVQSRDDKQFEKALREADILLPDGAGIVLAARILDLPLSERVAGFEYFYEFTKALNIMGGARFFFLGATDEVLGMIECRLKRDFPEIEIAGTYSPPFANRFSENDNREMVEKVNESGADVLWVGMTAPKQEIWISENKQSLNVPFIGAIGAVFDFYAGSKKRSPAWVRKLGLEWLPRLIREPVRLFRRNFISSPIFLALVGREVIRNRFRV